MFREELSRFGSAILWRPSKPTGLGAVSLWLPAFGICGPLVSVIVTILALAKRACADRCGAELHSRCVTADRGASLWRATAGP
jgi:hypothetical protein